MDYNRFDKRKLNENGRLSRTWVSNLSPKSASSRRESSSEILKSSKYAMLSNRQAELSTPSPEHGYLKQDSKFRSEPFGVKHNVHDHITSKDTAVKKSCNVIIRSFSHTPASGGHLSSSATISGNCLSHLAYLDDINSRLKRLEQSGLMKKLKSKTPNTQKIVSYLNETEESVSDRSSPQVNNEKLDKIEKVESKIEPTLTKTSSVSQNHHNNNNSYHHNYHSYQPQQPQGSNFVVDSKKIEIAKLFSEKQNNQQDLAQISSSSGPGAPVSRLPRSKSDFIVHSSDHQTDSNSRKVGENSKPKLDKMRKAKSIPKLNTNQETKIKPIEVNGKLYYVLNLIGVGGFSKVYQVYDPSVQMTYALKVVDLSKAEESAKLGLKNEIKLLERLKHCKRVVRLIDHELVLEKNQMILVMEKGDSDLGSVLKQFIETDNSTYLDLILLKHYWKEMLKAVSEIHKLGIVHSDLKPVNFISVGGKLKLIDFGIANAIQSDHTSVIKDHQVGTINYMAPEALCSRSDLDPSGGQSGKPYIKFNCKADVWSLGCILYNLAYGRPPFAHFQNLYSKLKAICDPKVEVNYPPHENPFVIDCLKVNWPLVIYFLFYFSIKVQTYKTLLGDI